MRQLAVSSLSKGIWSTLNFHESIGTDYLQPLAPQVSAVSIEPTWLLSQGGIVHFKSPAFFKTQ